MSTCSGQWRIILKTGPPEFGHNRFPSDSVADDANDARSDTMARRFTGTVNAPDFPTELDWLNTERPLTLADFSGKVLVLDFWTYC